ncbi:uncharacterized protein KD926_006791, partial [Aspergillus affinis]|uniref:uncharacterized protein n=1 Tax=Aspergillus affinis TaxID=1070780 RepID=UPI0022FE9D90
MSLYTLSGHQVWEQSPRDQRQPAEQVGYPGCNQHDIPRPEHDPVEQEDLVARFARQMNMAAPTPSGAPSQVPSPILYSITQHYHHSSHVVRRETPDGAPKEHLMLTETTSLDRILMNNNVNPSSLSPMQRLLFEYAIPEQRSRLIQMWQIYPANCTPSIAEAMAGGQTQGLETPFARTTPNHTPQSHHLYDDEICDQPPGENNDDGHHYAEPYMVSGYEDYAQKDHEFSANAIMSLTVEPTTGTPYKIANDPVY